MGAWGVKVLQNDYACDDLSTFLMQDPTRNFVYSLFDRGDEHQQLLGVAIVDASINGVNYDLLGGWGDYRSEGKAFFDNLTTDPLTDLLPYAKSIIHKLIDSGANSWKDPESRMEIYYTYLNRLNRA